MSNKLISIYQLLLSNFGKQNWWPAKSKGNARKFEISIGAILTQNTAWKNVGKALENLRINNLLNEKGIRKKNEKELALLIKPSGYYNQKAKKLKAFVAFLEDYPLEKLGKMSMQEVRALLLRVHGIGKETADSIMLYALSMPIFVIDAYTKRIFERLMPGKTKNLKEYDKWQKFFEKNLKKDAQLFNEYHALLVELGKNFCRKRPFCDKCPIIYVCKVH